MDLELTKYPDSIFAACYPERLPPGPTNIVLLKCVRNNEWQSRRFPRSERNPFPMAKERGSISEAVQDVKA
jgi:hypothetical protein